MQTSAIRRQIIDTYTKRDFQIFAAPNIHAGVVFAKVDEVLSLHRKQAARHRRRPESHVRKQSNNSL